MKMLPSHLIIFCISLFSMYVNAALDPNKCVLISSDQCVADPNNDKYIEPGRGTCGNWRGKTVGNNQDLGMKMSLPRVSILPEIIQPLGSTIAATTASFMNQVGYAFSPEQVIYRCGANTTGKLYEIFTTNMIWEDGDIVVGTAQGGREGRVFVANAQYIGFSIQNAETGQWIKDTWSLRPFKNLERDKQNAYLIKAKNFTQIWNVVLTRIDDKKNHHNVSSSIPYPWKGTVPQAYVSFKGPGFSDNVSDGASNNTYVADWPAGWIGQFHLPGTKAILDYRNAYCSVMNTTPIVRFSASTGSFINGNGVNGDQPITIQYYCNNIKKSDSGVSSGLMSMAFIANPGNLYGSTINGGAAKQYLISNGYGTTEIAKGVGVVLHYIDPSKNIRFSPSEFNLGLGAANGWHPVHENSVNISGNTWNKTINAKMIKLPDATEVTAGRYEASAKIVIKMQ